MIKEQVIMVIDSFVKSLDVDGQDKSYLGKGNYVIYEIKIRHQTNGRNVLQVNLQVEINLKLPLDTKIFTSILEIKF